MVVSFRTGVDWGCCCCRMVVWRYKGAASLLLAEGLRLGLAGGRSKMGVLLGLAGGEKG